MTKANSFLQESEKVCIAIAKEEIDAIETEMKLQNFGFNTRPEQWNEKTWKIIKMRLQFPAASNGELAKRLNVSREWVRIVLNRAKLLTHAETEYCSLKCAGCGVAFQRKKVYVNRRQAKGQTEFYHSVKCFSKSFGEQASDQHQRKWDYEAVYKLRREKGWGAIRISKELGIPSSTVTIILRNKKLPYKHQQKWDHEVVIQLRTGRGWGYGRIARELGMPVSSVISILKKGKQPKGLNEYKSKWDCGAVLKLHKEKGWGAVRIARELQIPRSTVTAMLKRLTQSR